MESFWQKQMRFDELRQPGWGDAANYFCERDMKFGTAELKIPAVLQAQTDTTAATPSPTTFGEVIKVLDIVPGQSHMRPATSQLGRRQMGLGLEKPRADNHIVSSMPNAVPNSLQREIVTPVQPVGIYPSVMRGWLITLEKSDSDKDMVTAPASPEEQITQ